MVQNRFDGPAAEESAAMRSRSIRATDDLAARTAVSDPVAPTLNRSRRTLLQAGGRGLLGLSLPALAAAKAASAAQSAAADRSAEERLAAERSSARTTTIGAGPPPRAKSVIFLFQWGGPSHLETFDRKPDAPRAVRGEFDDILTSVPGLTVCEHLPQMARVMDKVVLAHGVQHDMNNHNPAGYYALTGRRPPLDDIRLKTTPDLFPAYGSVVDRCAARIPGLPSFVAYPHTVRDGSVTPGQRASFLGGRHDPLVVLADPNAPQFDIPELSLPAEISAERLQQRREVSRLLDQQQAVLETAAGQSLDALYSRAYSMLLGDGVRKAFDLAQEPAEVRDRYGRTTYGQGCLLARRLVETGVRFVNVYFSDSIGGRQIGRGGWDTHGFDGTRMFPILKGWQLPITDQTLPTLLTDLDDRGLLDETLVVWMGEFGRTPRVNNNASRDHWPRCYTVLMAGGGLRRGVSVGRSDRFGSYPDEHPIRLGDIAATIYHQLGIDPETRIVDLEGRPIPIAEGRPLLDAIA